MQVRVYFNLHTKLWSIQCAKTRRVLGHANRVLLRDARFTVSQAGRERVLRERKKNVHAFVCGELEGAHWHTIRTPDFVPGWTRGDLGYMQASRRIGAPVTYNPFKGPTFVHKETGEPVLRADMVSMDTIGRSVLAFDPCNMTASESRRATA